MYPRDNVADLKLEPLDGESYHSAAAPVLIMADFASSKVRASDPIQAGNTLHS